MSNNFYSELGDLVGCVIERVDNLSDEILIQASKMDGEKVNVQIACHDDYFSEFEGSIAKYSSDGEFFGLVTKEELKEYLKEENERIDKLRRERQEKEFENTAKSLGYRIVKE